MPRLDDHVLRIWSRWAPLLLTFIGTLAMASPVLAQNNPPGQKPSSPAAPFQEKGLPPVSSRPTVTTPQTVTVELEGYAKNWLSQQAPPVERLPIFTIKDPGRGEFEPLGRYGLLILTVVTQSEQELPVKRVYLRMPDRETPLVKIASWRRNVDQTLVTYKMYGPYREDGFYLFPFSAYLRVAQLQVDFAANRSGLPVLELPFQDVPDWLRTMPNPDPLPGALPNLRALQAFINRRTSGFPIPTSLPQVAPEARRSTPGPSRQPDDARKPTALKDLFKK